MYCTALHQTLGTEKVPQRNCVTKIFPNVRVNFLVRFASSPLFYWVMTGNALELFGKFFGAVRAILWLCKSFLAPENNSHQFSDVCNVFCPNGKSWIETFIACTEADFENRPCARRKIVTKLLLGAFPSDPRKFVRKMCGGIQKCAEIVRNLCGSEPAQFAETIGVGLPRMCAHKFCAIFRQNLNFSLIPGCTGKKCLKSWTTVWKPWSTDPRKSFFLRPELRSRVTTWAILGATPGTGGKPIWNPMQGKKEYTPPPWHPSFLGHSPDPEVTEQKKLWCIPWENKGKGYTPSVWKEGYTPWRPQTRKMKKGRVPR